MTTPIAIVGMACRRPEASTSEELGDNALAARSAFRQVPGALARRVPRGGLAFAATRVWGAVESGCKVGRVLASSINRVPGSPWKRDDPGTARRRAGGHRHLLQLDAEHARPVVSRSLTA